jgi:hypothetical protein
LESTIAGGRGISALTPTSDKRERLILDIQRDQLGGGISLVTILNYPHEIVEDWESLIVATVERLNWSDPIVSVEKVGEPKLEGSLVWM